MDVCALTFVSPGGLLSTAAVVLCSEMETFLHICTTSVLLAVDFNI